MTRCFYCKGEIKESLTKFVVDLGDCVLVIKDVPGLVCCQCGEVSYSNDVAQQIEKIAETVRNSFMSEVAIVEFSKCVA